MTVHILRDYSCATTGYATSKFFAGFPYLLSLFLTKILGYSVVSNWAFNINSSARSLTITAATGAASVPSTITTSVPHGLSTGDTVQVTGASGVNINGTWMVSVVNATQAVLLNSLPNGTYVANSATLFTGFQYATGNPGGGTGASINLTSPTATYGVAIPSSVRIVAAGDVGKPLILKSSLYPTKNSGIFKISSVDIPNNRYTIDYRSSDTPPPETGTLTWWLYEVETQVSNYLENPGLSSNLSITAATNTTPIIITTSSGQPGFVTGQTIVITGGTGNTGVNGTWVITQVANTNNQYVLTGSVGNGTYNANTALANITGYYGDGYYYTSRVLLQSPHASGWQTRICVEPVTGGVPYVSVSVGMGGNSFADFPIGGVTSYIPLFFNQFATGAYVNTTTGGGNPTIANRYTFVGDDGGQGVFMYTRSLGVGANGLLSMGIPDNEPIPNAPNTDRAYVYASMLAINDFAGIQLRTMQSGDTVNGNIGAAYRSGLPELVLLSSWSPLEGVNNASTGAPPNSLWYSANAADSPFTGTTEVMPVEVWGGITTDPSLNLPIPSAGFVAYGLNQRFMGTAPFLRNGRANFGNFALSSDSIATLTVTGATNTSPIQITVTPTESLSTGQTVVISGVTGNTAANGTFVITVVDNTHFTLNGTTGNGTYAGGGTVNGTPHWLHLLNGIYLQWNGAAGLTP
jgi:hypothetical protein